MNKPGQTFADAIEEARTAVQQAKQEEVDRARVMRHVARKSFYKPPALLTPEKRAYLKRFGAARRRKVRR